MLQMHSVCLNYGGKQVLQDQDFSLPPGEHAALLGPSGCGKTSILLLAALLRQPDSGQVRRQKNAAMVFQEPRLLPWLTAEENVNLVLADQASSLPEARRWLERVELLEEAAAYPAALSGGMCQRLALARALAADRPLLLLDEPLKAMDVALRQRILQVLQEECRGKALLLATHDEDEARALDCCIFRYDGSRHIFREE